MKAMKPSMQVWNSLGNYYLCHAWQFMKILWKLIYPFFHNITNKNTDLENIKIDPGFKGLTITSRKCSSLCKLCWNFHENQFIRFPVMLSTDMDFLENIEKETQHSRGKKWHTKKNPDCSFYHAWPILKISWKSVHALFYNVNGMITSYDNQTQRFPRLCQISLIYLLYKWKCILMRTSALSWEPNVNKT